MLANMLDMLLHQAQGCESEVGKGALCFTECVFSQDGYGTNKNGSTMIKKTGKKE